MKSGGGRVREDFKLVLIRANIMIKDTSLVNALVVSLSLFIYVRMYQHAYAYAEASASMPGE